MKLIIIESPGKISSLSKILGPQYRVIASFGHVFDLPVKKLSIDVKNEFKPTFDIIPGKSDVIKTIKSEAKKAEAIYLCSDMDREGSAISFHIYNAIKDCTKAPIYRASFTQITKTAVLYAINNPRKIEEDSDLVESQMARRIIDRLAGYKTSFPTKMATGGISAGRVQSVALRILADREKEIKNFIPQEYWEMTADLLSPKKEPFSAKLDSKIEIKDEKTAREIYEKVRYGTPVIKEVISTLVEMKPYPPFVTQALCGAAKTYFGWSNDKTMKVAQDLYENGTITYMRTDSYSLDEGAITALRDYVFTTLGKEYIPDKPNFYKNKPSAQAGHEAIRPTDIFTITVSSGDHNKLYDLIWKKTAASQSVPSKEQRVRVVVDIAGYNFIANGNTILFDGWKKIFDYIKSESVILPVLKKGDICLWKS